MDEREFDEFFIGSQRRLTTQLFAMIGDWEEAQDCVQEAFVRAWDHRGRLDVTRHPEAWVRTTAYRLAVSRWRRVMRGRRPADRALGRSSEAQPPSADHVAVVSALRQLPEAQRQALVLHHIADLSVTDVAVELGVPEGTVKARLSRGRTALANLLGEGGPYPDRGSGGVTYV